MLLSLCPVKPDIARSRHKRGSSEEHLDSDKDLLLRPSSGLQNHEDYILCRRSNITGPPYVCTYTALAAFDYDNAKISHSSLIPSTV